MSAPPPSLAERLTALITAWRTAAGELRGWGADTSARAVERCAFQLEASIDDAPNGNGGGHD